MGTERLQDQLDQPQKQNRPSLSSSDLEAQVEQCDRVPPAPFPFGNLDLNTPLQTGKERDSAYCPSQSPFMHITKSLCSLLGAMPALDIEWLKAGRGWEVDLPRGNAGGVKA